MDDYYAYLSHERQPSALPEKPTVHSRGSLEKLHPSERLVEVELHHPVSRELFTLEYDRKIGQDDQQTERASSEDGYIVDEDSSLDGPSSSNSPVPSESASCSTAGGGVTSLSSSDWIGLPHHHHPPPTMMMHDDHTDESPPRDSSSMNDGHFFDTSGYASNNSSKDEVHSGSASSAASVRSASPDGLSPPLLLLLPTTADPVAALPALHNQLARAKSDTSSEKDVRLTEETPIEKDIRQAALRESELRLQQSMGSLRLSDQGKSVTASKNALRQTAASEHLNYTNTQRILATTRLQQEIEEQKRRELDLKRDGRVKSISEERMDDDSAFDDRDSVATQLSSPSSSATADPALQTATIKNQRAFFESASKPESFTPPVKAPPKLAGTLPVPKKPPTVRQSLGTMKMPVSMEHFISSRGKAVNGSRILASPSVSSFVNGGATHDVYVDFSAMRVPLVKTVELQEKELIPVKKYYRTAKTKISEELREMEKREAELRQTRTTLGNSADPTDSPDSTVIEAGASEGQKAACHVKELVKDSSLIPKGRQSILLAQWEARAQQ